MDIYTDEGSLDYEKARAAVAASGKVTSDPIRKAQIAELQTAALIDLAESFSMVALEAMLAMPQPDAPAPGEDLAEFEVEAGEFVRVRDFLIVGDLVHVIDDTEPGEVRRLGVDQGEVWAEVDFANGVQGMRYFSRNLKRIIGDAPDAEFVEDVAALTALEAEQDREDELEEGLADVDTGGMTGAEIDGKLGPDADEGEIEDDFEPTALDKLDGKKKSKKKGGSK